MADIELWKSIGGYEGLYEVSSLGRVRSLDRVVRHVGRGKVERDLRVLGRHLKASPAGKGYLFVSLSNGGTVSNRYVHQLVIEAFAGPRPPGVEAAHGDGDLRNNALSNLQYKTPIDNNADKALHGTDGRGERNAAAKLGPAEVAEILRLKGAKLQREIADQFGVSQTCVSDIHRGKSWGHLAP